MNQTFALLFFAMLFSSCQQGKNVQTEFPKSSSQENFWKELKSLCGKSFYGKIVEAPDNDTVFRNKELILHIRGCEENRIRTPFIVGQNRSRTFVFTRTNHGLSLQHDHRHSDGISDSITMYGGHTNNTGSAIMQVFPADQHTVNILPAAVGNVWWIELSKGSFITYNLRRVGTERLFSVRFNLNEPAPTPPAPWGWKD